MRIVDVKAKPGKSWVSRHRAMTKHRCVSVQNFLIPQFFHDGNVPTTSVELLQEGRSLGKLQAIHWIQDPTTIFYSSFCTGWCHHVRNIYLASKRKHRFFFHGGWLRMSNFHSLPRAFQVPQFKTVRGGDPCGLHIW